MRKLIALGSILTTSLISTAALAQDSAQGDTPAAIGADLAFILPLGDFSDATGPLLGPLLKLEYLVAPGVEVTGRIGYLYGFSKEINIPFAGKITHGMSDIPIWAGARYFFNGTREGAYAGGEFGLNILSFRAEAGGVSNSDTETKFGINLGGGYKIGDIDLRAQLQFLDLGHMGDSMGLGLSAGYSFAKF